MRTHGGCWRHGDAEVALVLGLVLGCSSPSMQPGASDAGLDGTAEAAMHDEAGNDGRAVESGASCGPPASPCPGAVACCAGLSCPAEIGACCGFEGNGCATRSDCCVGACTGGQCSCLANEQPCALASDCCSGACDGTKCICATNLYCSANADCCQGMCDFATHRCN